MKKTTTWILIVDGTRARVVEHAGPGKGLATVDGLDWSIPPLQAQDIDTDGYGRGPTGGAMTTGNDPAKHREAEFVRSVAAAVHERAMANAFERLVIAAAPVALGNLRKALSEHVRKRVVAELDKDLTNVPTAQLDRYLDGIIAT